MPVHARGCTVLYTERAVINVWQVMKHEEKEHRNMKQCHVDKVGKERQNRPQHDNLVGKLHKKSLA